MPLVYSPINGDEWKEPFELYPKHGFMMLQSGGSLTENDAFMQKSILEASQKAGFNIKTATDVRRTGDFLQKITKLIMGCGFGVAVFSKETPPRTLGNVFFEVGYCLALGKPVVFVVSGGREAVPSDFVRSEWINFDPLDVGQFHADLDAAMNGLKEQSEFFQLLADAAWDAEVVDYELVVERYKRSALINGAPHALDRLRDTEKRVRRATPDPVFASQRINLLDNIKHFLRLFR